MENRQIETGTPARKWGITAIAVGAVMVLALGALVVMMFGVDVGAVFQ